MSKTIITRVGKTRRSEKVTYEDGKIAIRCYTRMNPHYFKDEKGTLNPIEIDKSEIVTSGVGDMTLKSKNIVSVGIRRDSSTEKYLGLRPDETQALGTEQLEFSIESTIFNGEDIFVDLSKNDIIDPITMDLGGVVVRNNRQFSRQMTKVDRELSDFTIKYKLYLKGLHFQNNISNKVNETLRSNTSIKSTELGAVQSSDFVREISKDTEDFEIISAHITDDHIWLTDNPLGGYTDTFESMGPVPDGYSIHHWDVPLCTPISMKNSVGMTIKNSPIGKQDLFDLVKESLLLMTGGVFADDVTIQRDGKIIAQFLWDGAYKIFWIMIACELSEIQEDIAPIGLSPSAATAEFLTIFNKAINKSEIILNGEYIEADEHNRFTIVNDKGEFKFNINKPKLLNSNFDIVSDRILHTLKKIEDDIYEYIKYPDLSCFVGAKDIAYIDAEIAYSSLGDGCIVDIQATWGAVHGSSQGTTIYKDTIVNYVDTYRTYIKTIAYGIFRAWYYFDTSAITSDIKSVSWWAYHTDETWNPAEEFWEWADFMVVMEGTQSDTLALADFNNFTGSSYGSVTPSLDAWKEIVFNSTGIGGIQKGGTTKICAREKGHDYDNISPPAVQSNYYWICHHCATDYTGSTYDPYLEITLTSKIKPIMMVF